MAEILGVTVGDIDILGVILGVTDGVLLGVTPIIGGRPGIGIGSLDPGAFVKHPPLIRKPFF